MDILIVAATIEETNGIDFAEIERSTPHTIEVLITGVGMVATSYALTKKLSAQKFEMAINIGLAGSFSDNIKIGDVVNVTSDCFADLGAEDDEKFLKLDEMGLFDKNSFPFNDGKIIAGAALVNSEIDKLKEVNSITVNKTHGNEKSIEQVKKIFKPDIETMEGAAFFYTCLMESIPCLQMRAISNKVEKRNRNNWNISLALKNLSSLTNNFFNEIGENIDYL